MRDIKDEQIDKVKQIFNDEIADLHRRQRDSKKRRKREAYLRERAAYKIKAINKLNANGLPVLIFILLCSTPEALGLVDASCGGTHLKGFEYDRCDSTIAIDYIIDTLMTWVFSNWWMRTTTLVVMPTTHANVKSPRKILRRCFVGPAHATPRTKPNAQHVSSRHTSKLATD